MMTRLLAFLLLACSALGQGFYSWPNPTFGTAYGTNVVALEKLSLNGLGGPWADSDGVMTLRNNAGSSFDRLVIGPAATTSWPAIRANGSTLQIRLGDHSGWAPISVGALTLNSTILPATDNATDLGSTSFSFASGYFDGDVFAGSGGKFQFTSRTKLESSADGVIAFRTAASGNMTRVIFGTANSSGPALSFSGTTIQATDGVGGLVPFSANTIELGNASDTTLARSGSGVVTIEGVTVAERPTTTALTYSGTNVTLTATSHVLHGNTLTLTNNCLLTITSADGASGGITIVPDGSTSYTVYLASAIKLLGGGSSFVVTNSASETVNLEWKQTLRGGSSVILANKAVYP